jgi:hypothetical protein
MNDLLRPTYAAVQQTVVIGNNKAFTEAVIRAADVGDGLEETSNFRKFKTRLKEQGFAAEPALAGGFFYPPLFRESLDGSLSHLAKQLVYTWLNGNEAVQRAEVIAELRRLGREPTEDEIGRGYNDATERKIQEQEAELRRMVQAMDSMKWAAFEATTPPKGIALRFALEFR